MYDEVALSRWIEEAVRKAGITVLLGTILRGVSRDARKVRELELATRYGDVKLAAAGFVDATGDAALTWEAGFECREPADGPVYGTQMMVLEGDRRGAAAEPRSAHRAAAREGRRLRPRAHAGIRFRVSGPRHRAGQPHPCRDAARAGGGLAQRAAGKAQADRVLDFLKREYPQAFGQARVRSYGLPGIRQTRWIKGRQQLTVDDVRAGTRFPDAIARTAWPIELHDSPQGYVWEAFADDHLHYVPFGSLVPAEADNIVAAGRCIDGDNAALSSVRVMGPCIAMGAAAAHALDLAGSGSVQQIDVAALRKRVWDNVERAD